MASSSSLHPHPTRAKQHALTIGYAVNKEKEFFIFRKKSAIPSNQNTNKFRKWSNMWSRQIL
jgi:hypothetical protein